MVATASTMLKLGSLAPGFSLQDTNEKTFNLEEIAGQHGCLVMFICNHCPFVIHLIEPLARLCNEWKAMGFGVVAINSNDVVKYPADHPNEMKKFAAKHAFAFPYVFDHSQDVAKAYRAACTPDFFLFDSNLSLAYRGQFDSSRPGRDQICDGRDLSAAVFAVAAGKKASPRQEPSIGCNIKWQIGKEPEYFL